MRNYEDTSTAIFSEGIFYPDGRRYDGWSVTGGKSLSPFLRVCCDAHQLNACKIYTKLCGVLFIILFQIVIIPLNITIFTDNINLEK